MNTNQLKKFAQGARIKLIEQVTAKLDYVLTHDTAELRGRADTVRKLREEINAIGRQSLIDKVAYTWFNRFIALRFMDANGFQPLGHSVVTPVAGQVSPQILDEAHAGHIADELPVDRQAVMDLLDGRVQSGNPDNDAYRLLLVASCNHLSSILPFLFERINDYTELLLPEDLTSSFSIVKDVVDGMSEEDCKEVEIIGWLYQFYISERNEELIQSKKIYTKDELAPASQLFTPKWIVKYMVDNTLGQLWTEINPSTKITNELEFYIKPAYLEQLPKRATRSVEDIKFFEPCMGSGHILSYAFDVFYMIYEEQGYNPSDIPQLILKNNLWGVDIDPRAAQMAGFVLMMKCRQKYRRFFNVVNKVHLQPNTFFYTNFNNDSKFSNATVLGSLIKVEQDEINQIEIDKDSLFRERQTELHNLYRLLGQRYDVVVTNPPYINSSRMESSLKQFVELYYPETKSDLFSTFILRCLELCNEDGLTGYMTPFVWMFISSYEKLRQEIISHHFINNLIQLEYSGFDGATVPICTFTLRKKPMPGGHGSYIRLSDFKGVAIQAPKTLEAIHNNKCGWYHIANQNNFEKISGTPISYWIGEEMIKVLENKCTLGDEGSIGKGLDTGNNERFLRFWHEVAKVSNWVPCQKGGSYRKWYGNNDYVIYWYNYGEDLKSYEKSNLRNSKNYFNEGITWTRISSGKPAFRKIDKGFIFESTGPCAFFREKDEKWILGFLNSKITVEILKVFAPTLDFQSGHISKLPYIPPLSNSEKINLLVEQIIKTCKLDWDKNESSWDFRRNSLLEQSAQDIVEAFELYQHYWKNKFNQMHTKEEELNQFFIEVYGLQNEITPELQLENITLLKEETSIENCELVFQKKPIFFQFVSYAAGCMFGRYSLDKEGLLLANQGENIDDYLSKVGKSKSEISFLPDEDNIIPILDDEWFEDDIVSRFHEFLKVSFGEKNFRKNLAFVEECLGKGIRQYFTKDFYKDHIQRYKKRPIYWMFSSPKGYFNVLIYMHRYTPDTLNIILNSYLREFIEKLELQRKQMLNQEASGSATEQNKARKQIDKIDLMLADCRQYEAEILYPLASERIEIDLDDGVLVNYNKFGKAIAPVDGLNDAKTKKKVKEFDWIDTSTIK